MFFKETEGPTSDFSNTAAIQTAEQHDSFTYDADFEDGIELINKGPVELENGALYTG